jgi:VIT1/CCC1 family predicted Fe2+/Mn2+ transporter
MYSLYFTVVFGARLLGVGMVYGYPQLGASAGSLVCLSVNVDGISIAGLLFLVHLAYYLLGALVLVLCMMISKKSVSLMQSILLSLLAGVFVWAGLWYASSLFMLY